MTKTKTWTVQDWGKTGKLQNMEENSKNDPNNNKKHENGIISDYNRLPSPFKEHVQPGLLFLHCTRFMKLSISSCSSDLCGNKLED